MTENETNIDIAKFLEQLKNPPVDKLGYLSPIGRIQNIELVSPDNYQLEYSGERLRGATLFFKNKIVLADTLTDDDIYIILAHECTHATLFDTQLDSKDNYSEENMCDFMGVYGKHIIREVDRIYHLIMELIHKGE